MSEKIALIRFPALLLVLFFVGKLVVGALGGSYELGNRLFAMVPLTIHMCLAWGAVSRAYQGYRFGQTLQVGILIALVAQILILFATAASYLLDVETHFSNPIAIVGEERLVPFGEAMGARLAGLVVNSIIGAIAAAIGWALGRLIPVSEKAAA